MGHGEVVTGVAAATATMVVATMTAAMAMVAAMARVWDCLKLGRGCCVWCVILP